MNESFPYDVFVFYSVKTNSVTFFNFHLLKKCILNISHTQSTILKIRFIMAYEHCTKIGNSAVSWEKHGKL
jgi:hypothetical protein